MSERLCRMRHVGSDRRKGLLRALHAITGSATIELIDFLRAPFTVEEAHALIVGDPGRGCFLGIPANSRSWRLRGRHGFRPTGAAGHRPGRLVLVWGERHGPCAAAKG